MRLLFSILAISIGTFVLAEEAPTDKILVITEGEAGVPHVVGSGLMLGIDEQRKPVYYALQNDQYVELTNVEVQDILSGLLNSARDLACRSPIRPDSVSASAWAVSVSWDTARLCAN